MQAASGTNTLLDTERLSLHLMDLHPGQCPLSVTTIAGAIRFQSARPLSHIIFKVQNV